jgi:hypothetical protein
MNEQDRIFQVAMGEGERVESSREGKEAGLRHPVPALGDIPYPLRRLL